jgi:hypothetical protein
VKARWPDLPVLKPNEAMIEEATAVGGRVALVASFAPTLASMPAEFPAHVALVPVLAHGAMQALDHGDGATHDARVAEAAAGVAAECDVVALAQFSLARAAPLVAQRTGRPVLVTPDSAVRKLRARLDATA